MATIEIIAYKTSDGKIFENESDAVDYETTTRLKNKIEAFVVTHGFEGMEQSDIEDLIFEKRNELFEILGEGR